MRVKTKSMVFGGLLLALGVLLPQVFHLIGGSATGGMLLPMHIPVLIGGFLLGPVYGLFIGIITPLLSFVLTGMPPMAPIPRLLFMVFELAAYGAFAGLFYRRLKLNLYVSLIAAQLLGRISLAIGILLTTLLLQIDVPVIATVTGAVTTGLPGILIQLIFIPPLLYALKKAGVDDGIA